MNDLQHIMDSLVREYRKTGRSVVIRGHSRMLTIPTSHAVIHVEHKAGQGKPYVLLTAHYHERNKDSHSGIVNDNFVDGIIVWVDNFIQECIRVYSEKLPYILQSNSDVGQLHDAFRVVYGPQVGKRVHGNFKVGKFTINAFYTRSDGGDMRVRFHHEDKLVTKDVTVRPITSEVGWSLRVVERFNAELHRSINRERALYIKHCVKAEADISRDAIANQIRSTMESVGFIWVSEHLYKCCNQQVMVLPVLPDSVYMLYDRTRTWDYARRTKCKIEDLAELVQSDVLSVISAS